MSTPEIQMQRHRLTVYDYYLGGARAPSGSSGRGQTQKKIETYLADALAGDKATHTM